MVHASDVKTNFQKKNYLNIQSILKIWTILSKEIKITSSIHKQWPPNLYGDKKMIMIQSKVFNEQSGLGFKVCM